MEKFKSQIGQDKYISDVIFNNKKNGYFIELGATDGITLSNTHYFEKELGWNGVCIEPNPDNIDKLKKNRNCHVSNSLIYSKSGEKKNFNIVNCNELSGIDNHIGNIGNSKVSKTIVLNTKTLTEVLDDFKAPKYIDYLSLDTEGSELEILKGLDFKKYIIGYISVEHNYKQPIRNEISIFLQSKGYIYSRWNKFDDEYIHYSLADVFMWSNKNTVMTPKISI